MHISFEETPLEQIYWMNYFGMDYDDFIPYAKRQALHKFVYILDWMGVSFSHPFLIGSEGPFSPELAEQMPYLKTVQGWHLENLSLSVSPSQIEHVMEPPGNTDFDSWIRAFGAFLFNYQRLGMGVEKATQDIKGKIDIKDWNEVEKALKNRLFYIRMQA